MNYNQLTGLKSSRKPTLFKSAKGLPCTVTSRTQGSIICRVVLPTFKRCFLDAIEPGLTTSPEFFLLHIPKCLFKFHLLLPLNLTLHVKHVVVFVFTSWEKFPGSNSPFSAIVKHQYYFAQLKNAIENSDFIIDHFGVRTSNSFTQMDNVVGAPSVCCVQHR